MKTTEPLRAMGIFPIGAVVLREGGSACGAQGVIGNTGGDALPPQAKAWDQGHMGKSTAQDTSRWQ